MKSKIIFWISTIVLLVSILLLINELNSSQNQEANSITGWAWTTNYDITGWTWTTDYDLDGEWCLIRSSYMDSIPHKIEVLIPMWNKCCTPKLSFLKTNADTVYIGVDAGDLFSCFGTTGAERILAEIVFTMTEDSRYPNVFLNFEEANHASPGNYCRNYFIEQSFFIVCNPPDETEKE